MTKLEDLQERVDKIRESTPPPPTRLEIISGFINEMPWELRRQVNEWIKDRIHELEGETKAN